MSPEELKTVDEKHKDDPGVQRLITERGVLLEALERARGYDFDGARDVVEMVQEEARVVG